MTFENRFPEWRSRVAEPCDCPAMFDPEPGRSSHFHLDGQNTPGEAWRRLVDLIHVAAADGRETFAPGRELPTELWREVVVLPADIALLKDVRHLVLYGSNLIAVPPEIGDMVELEVFEPYTSHRLHWYPYEITRCTELRDSTVSTRVLYGNSKTRAPFPRLPAELPQGSLPTTCSVCRDTLVEPPLQRWISLRVATDVLPLLVNACSQECVDALPESAVGYIDGAHDGGPEVQQPVSEYGLPVGTAARHRLDS